MNRCADGGLYFKPSNFVAYAGVASKGSRKPSSIMFYTPVMAIMAIEFWDCDILLFEDGAIDLSSVILIFLD